MSFLIYRIHAKDLERLLNLCKNSCAKIIKDVKSSQNINNRKWITPEELGKHLNLDVQKIKDLLIGKVLIGLTQIISLGIISSFSELEGVFDIV